MSCEDNVSRPIGLRPRKGESEREVMFRQLEDYWNRLGKSTKGILSRITEVGTYGVGTVRLQSDRSCLIIWKGVEAERVMPQFKFGCSAWDSSCENMGYGLGYGTFFKESRSGGGIETTAITEVGEVHEIFPGSNEIKELIFDEPVVINGEVYRAERISLGSSESEWNKLSDNALTTKVGLLRFVVERYEDQMGMVLVAAKHSKGVKAKEEGDKG